MQWWLWHWYSGCVKWQFCVGKLKHNNQQIFGQNRECHCKVLADMIWKKVVAGIMLAAKAVNDIQRASSVQMHSLFVIFAPHYQ